MPAHRSPVAVTAAMNGDLQYRFRLATIAGLGAALTTWLLNGYMRFDSPDSIGTAGAGALAFGLVATAAFVVPYLVPREWRVLETLFSVARRSSRTRREAYGDGSVPATPKQATAWLARHPDDTVETRGARVWAYLVLGDLGAAQRTAARMPDASPSDRYHRVAAGALLRLVAGGEPALEDLRRAAGERDHSERRGSTSPCSRRSSPPRMEGDWRAAILVVRNRVGGAVGLVLVRWFLPVVGFIAAGTLAMTLIAYGVSLIDV
jgi:hypothetical protein